MAVMGGHLDMESAPASNVMELLAAGKVRLLAISAPQRGRGALAQVPTWKELGVNSVNEVWRGIAGPKGMPADVQAKLVSALKKIYDSKDYQTFMAGRGLGMIYADGKGFEQFMAKGDADMGNVMKALGLAK